MNNLRMKPVLLVLLLVTILLATGSCSSTDIGGSKSTKHRNWVKYSNTAKINIQNHQYEEAIINIERAIDAEPSEYLLHLGKANLLEKLGRRQEALDYLSGLIRDDSNQSQFLELRGRFLLQLGYWESAREDLYYVYENSEKRDLGLLKQLILLEQKSEKPVKSKLLVDTALKLAPKNHELWFQKGKLELGMFRFKDAEKSIRKAISFNKNALNYHQIYIETLLLLKNKTATETHLLKMVQRFPEDDWGKTRLAAIWVENGALESAKAMLEDTLITHPGKALIYYHLATIYAEQKNWRIALDYYLGGIKRDTNSSWANVQIAKIYRRVGDTNAALTHLKSAFDQGSRDLYVYETLAKIYNMRDETYSAERVIIEGLRISSKNQVLLSEYGTLFEKRGNLKEAIRAYQEIITIHPQNFYIHGKMGNLFRMLKQFERAEIALKKAKNLSPETSWVRAYLVELYSEQLKWAHALSEIEEMIRYRPVDYWPHARKGLILQKLYRYNSSLHAIDNAISLASDNKVDVRWLFEVRGEILASLERYDEAEKSMLLANNSENNDPIVLTKLAYIQNNLDKRRSLNTIKRVIYLEDVGIDSIELYAYLTGQYINYWNFKKGGLAEKTYIKIIEKKFTQVESLLKELEGLLDPHLPFLTYLRDYLLLGNKAKLDISEKIKKETRVYWHYYYLGTHELNFGNKQQAKTYFDYALLAHPDNPWFLVKQAFTLENLKESKAAILLLKKFLIHFPDSNWAKVRLALNYDLALQPELSEKTYLEILKKEPNRHIVLNNLAWLYLTTQEKVLKKTDEALLLSQRAVKLKATSANLDTLAEAYFQKKEYSAALKAIEKALDIDRKNLDYFKKQKKKILKAIAQDKKNHLPSSNN